MGLGFSILGPCSFSYAQGSHTSDSDDGLEETLRSYREDNRNAMEKLEKTHGSGAVGNSSQLPISPENLDPIIKKLNSVYSGMSYESSRAQIEENISNSPAKGLAKALPKFVDFVTQLLRHNTAMLNLTKMFKDKKKLLYFFLANVFTLILGFILTKMMSKDGGFFKRLARWLFRKSFVYGLRIFILIFFFGTELAPAFNIFKDVFL